jgi:Protein of unknown function (DUF2550)
MRVVIGILVLLVALALLGYALLVLRRWVLGRAGGTFDCSLRANRSGPAANMGKGWALGLGRYAEDDLQWFRVFSFSPRPRRVLPRRELVIRRRRQPQGAEALALLAGALVVECVVDDRPLELGMTEDALTGLLSWLEAAPPGRHLDVA